MHLPMTISSRSEAFFLMSFHMSMVKIVDAELKMEVREDMSAASMTASIKPRIPEEKRDVIEPEQDKKSP